jgi:hypothetical protein
LSVIRAALAARPDVAAPAGTDWSGFMARLDEAVRREPASNSIAQVLTFIPRRSYTSYLAVAAVLTLVTMSVLFVARSRPAPPPAMATVTSTPAPAEGRGLASVSEQHFERSKLVLLGLATKDPRSVSAADWGYERELASTLLNDTRLYRMAAEDRGLQPLADVMGDLEIVLLQTSMSTADAKADDLEQLQRLIRKRDLLTKMEVVGRS